MQILLMFLLFLTALFLILLVLVQRGKGGGLAGAFGGMGGQSAFGTKAGDLFTRVTIGVAAFWIILCVASIKLLGGGEEMLEGDMGGEAPVKQGLNAPPFTGEDAGAEQPLQPLPGGESAPATPEAQAPAEGDATP